MRGPSPPRHTPVDAVGGKHLPFDADPVTEPSHVEHDVGRVAGEREVGDVDGGVGVGGPQIDERDVLAAVEEHAGHDFDRLRVSSSRARAHRRKYCRSRCPTIGGGSTSGIAAAALWKLRNQATISRTRGSWTAASATRAAAAGSSRPSTQSRTVASPARDPIGHRTPRLRSGRATVRGIAPASARYRRSPGPAAGDLRVGRLGGVEVEGGERGPGRAPRVGARALVQGRDLLPVAVVGASGRPQRGPTSCSRRRRTRHAPCAVPRSGAMTRAARRSAMGERVQQRDERGLRDVRGVLDVEPVGARDAEHRRLVSLDEHVPCRASPAASGQERGVGEPGVVSARRVGRPLDGHPRRWRIRRCRRRCRWCREPADLRATPTPFG